METMRGNLAEILQKIGRDAALPGVDLAIELLQELRADLMGGGVNYVEAEVIPAPKRLGRPPGSKGRGSSWNGMTQGERSAEMKRRKAVSRVKHGETVKIKGMHPRDPRHPGHDAWIEKIKAAQGRLWDAMTPKQRRDRSAKMRAGQKKVTARTAVNELKVNAA